jgi:hypothetical protein
MPLDFLAARAIHLTIVAIPIFCRHGSHSLCLKLADMHPQACEAVAADQRAYVACLHHFEYWANGQLG